MEEFTDIQFRAMLKRRMFLQRYVNQLTVDARRINAPGDALLVGVMRDFADDATEADRIAFARHRRGNEAAQNALREVRDIVRQQQEELRVALKASLADLAVEEVEFNARVLGISNPGAAGVASQANAGQTIDDAVRATYGKYYTRLIAEARQTAATDISNLGPLIKGTLANGRKDGLLRQRDDNQIRPLIDVAANGTAANAAEYTMVKAGVEQIEHLATLDFRTCLVAGTMLKTPEGYASIESLKDGDTVISGEGVPRKVRSPFKKEANRIVKVTLENGAVINCTPDHKFLTQRGWMEIQDVTKDDIMMTPKKCELEP